MKRLVLNIQGMSCGHCLQAVNAAIAKLDGVIIDSVRMGRAEVSFDEGAIGPAQVSSALEAAGYRVESIVES